ncbi:MAG: hypothetical protein A2219_08255 [Elusimicrobia bacterium RIFOXYA2_FULL_50_26]|nr:MAG: hypothetical protein A2219_08255 [Elusimicrobia bacterium RIFOXYA2_FULL_50_26]OGS25312.1 MAG: hypothetical protein A2314_00860 [Elusimicrobia bacterium RIFOXYB2_FULL_50_12]
MKLQKLATPETIESKILILRNKKILLDKDLAGLYEVKPIALRQQVKRNLERFPDDFMFQLTNKEVETMVSQNVIPSKKYFGGHLPYAFTQEGIAMLSSVIRSKKAVDVNIQIMRVFVKIREFIYTHKELAQKINQLERKYDHHDYQIQKLFDKTRDIPILPEKQIKIDGFNKTKK